jgi:hypothetical protein
MTKIAVKPAGPVAIAVHIDNAADDLLPEQQHALRDPTL